VSVAILYLNPLADVMRCDRKLGRYRGMVLKNIALTKSCGRLPRRICEPWSLGRKRHRIDWRHMLLSPIPIP